MKLGGMIDISSPSTGGAVVRAGRALCAAEIARLQKSPGKSHKNFVGMENFVCSGRCAKSAPGAHHGGKETIKNSRTEGITLIAGNRKKTLSPLPEDRGVPGEGEGQENSLQTGQVIPDIFIDFAANPIQNRKIVSIRGFACHFHPLLEVLR